MVQNSIFPEINNNQLFEAIPDYDIKKINFFKIRIGIEASILSINNLTFFIFYDNQIRVCFYSSDRNFQVFLNNFNNIYPVRYEKCNIEIKNMMELHFKRDPMFPVFLKFDFLSFLANNFESIGNGILVVQLIRRDIYLSSIRKGFVLYRLIKTKNKNERIIAKQILEKLNSPLYYVRIFTNHPEIFSTYFDFVTGQGLSIKGKKIFMTTKELAYLIHFPLSYNTRRKPW